MSNSKSSLMPYTRERTESVTLYVVKLHGTAFIAGMQRKNDCEYVRKIIVNAES